MSSIYLLFVIFINDQGYEYMDIVSNTKHKTLLECKSEKHHHKDMDNLKFFCANENSFFNKKQKFY